MPTPKPETRALGTLAPAADLKVRGYAVVWEPAYDMGREMERVDPNAFARSMEEPGDIALLWNHDTGKPLARVRAGNLRLFTDATGLGFEATLPDTATAREAHALVESGVVTQCSFGFMVRAEKYEKGVDKPTRVILDADLLEISLVTFPANPATSVEAREAQAETVRRTIRLLPPR
jgi:HK97 family phage prohead protease